MAYKGSYAAPPSCEWHFEEVIDGEGYYETECGHSFFFADGDITDNEFEYCPYCGRTIDC